MGQGLWRGYRVKIMLQVTKGERFIRGNEWVLALSVPSARALQRFDGAETWALSQDCGAAIIESQLPARPRRRPSAKLSIIPLHLR